MKLHVDTVKYLLDCSVGVQEDDWVKICDLPVEDQGKYQYEQSIFLHLPTGKFYGFFATRSGSYFSEYHYGYEEDSDGKVELLEVKPKKVVTIRWEVVK